MILVVPSVPGSLHPRVVPAITNQGYVPKMVTVGNDDHYPHLLRDLFESGKDFCVIEQDVESRPGFLSDFEACPEPWCYFAYHFELPYDQAIGFQKPWFAPLGHTRFKEGVGEKIASLLGSPEFLSHWLSRDVMISDALHKAGFSAHRHRGFALHWHRY